MVDGHHPDCDEFMLHHGRVVVDDHGTFVAVCQLEDCTWRSPDRVGSWGTRANADTAARSHDQWLPCDGRCRAWLQDEPTEREAEPAE
jgi:hypothetical protein